MHTKTVLEVNLENLLCNYRALQSFCNTRIYAVVKANAYGLGLLPVVDALVQGGVKDYAVNSVEEAQVIRSISHVVKILLLSPTESHDIPTLIKENITATLTSHVQAIELNRIALRSRVRVPVHIKVDTGMNRFGVCYEQALSIVQAIQTLSNLKIEGIWSHLSNADDEDPEATQIQLTRFEELVRGCWELGLRVEYHIANSAGALRFRGSHYNAVRSGIFLYGCLPHESFQSAIKIKKVIELRSHILEIKTVRAGEYISYGRGFCATKDMRIGVVGAGYADGYPRHLSHKGEVILKGQRTKLLGTVCMEAFMIDLSDIHTAKLGDEVLLIGQGITEEELARKSLTIPYEILTRLSTSLQRVYKKPREQDSV